MSCWGTASDWLLVVGTLVLAGVAVFQETIRGWFYHPRFQISTKTEPPDCFAVPYMSGGTFVANSIFIGIWVENVGNATAKNAEVYAKALQRKRVDGVWERVLGFAPMNLKWANIDRMYFPSIAPQMGKHCNVGHIVDPSCRHLMPTENVSRLGLTDQQTSLAFEVIAAPNHGGHIVGPGEYRLEILVAAENATPLRKTLEISLRGSWYTDDTQMLRDGIGMSIRPHKK